MKLEDIHIKIFADCADLNQMQQLAKLPYIKGFTTNPTLMRKAGVILYEEFVRAVVEKIPDKPVSFEVFADDFDEMERQARRIACWGENIYVKIPITNTRGQSSAHTIHRLSCDGIKINVTAMFTRKHADLMTLALATGTPSILSYFMGRINDTGESPYDFRGNLARGSITSELLWASTRELFCIKLAQECRFDIITVTPEILAKLPLLGKDLNEYSLETVKQFREDAMAAGYTL